MGCTAGCLNITLNNEKHKELFAETFMEVMNEDLYEPFEDNDDVLELFGAEDDLMFTLDAAVVQCLGVYDIIGFIKEFF